MTDHERFEELIAPYLYSELSESDARALRDHLEACSACSAEIADFEKVRRGWHEGPEETPGLSDFTRKRIILNASRRMKARRSVTWRPLVAVAAALVLTVLGGLTYFWNTRAPEVGMTLQAKQAPSPAQAQRLETVPPSKPLASAPAPLRSASDEVAGEGVRIPAKQPDAAKRKAEAPGAVSGRTSSPAGAFAPAPMGVPEEQLQERMLADGKVAAPEDLAKKRDVAAESEEAVARSTPINADKQAAAPEQKKTVAGGTVATTDKLAASETTAPAFVGASAPAPPSAALDDFDHQLARADQLLDKGQRKEAVDAYRRLLHQFPAREREILRNVHDQKLLDEIKRN